jgi:hypothetical protein
MSLLIVLVVLGGLGIVGGVGWIYPPAGVITAGVMLLTGAYMAAYFRARK